MSKTRYALVGVVAFYAGYKAGVRAAKQSYREAIKESVGSSAEGVQQQSDERETGYSGSEEL